MIQNQAKNMENAA